MLSGRCFSPAGGRGRTTCGYGLASRRVPPSAVGRHSTRQRTQWNVARHTRQNRRSAPRYSHDAERVRQLLERRWEATARPLEGWIWPAPTKAGHIDHSSLKKQHKKALKLSGVRPFVLYSLRHTFLTRLGQSGCDVWTLARVAGHSSVSVSSRYVHPSEDAVLSAMSRLSGHNSGHSDMG